jgi:glycosyltransferase involved in cell wall biosynthesis
MKYKLPKRPFVTICTPTFNRRPFIPMMIKCFEHQSYPKDKIEWIILDDGTDKIEDLVSHIPQVKYMKYEEKMPLGKKRNIGNDLAKGDIIIYMDDDDYYPPERISHAVTILQTNDKVLCTGSSEMLIYFKDLNKMYKVGPYGPNHSTAATFAFRKELLKESRFNEESSVAEERNFLKEYTIPFAQLDSKKSILVFSHSHNSCNKKELLEGLKAPPDKINIFESDILPSDIIKNPEILKFFMEDIDNLLDKYEPGKPQNKSDVTKQIVDIKEKRETFIKQKMKEQSDYQEIIQKTMNLKGSSITKIDELTFVVNNLTLENNQLKEKNAYLEDKIKKLIDEKIERLKADKIAKQII